MDRRSKIISGDCPRGKGSRGTERILGQRGRNGERGAELFEDAVQAPSVPRGDFRHWVHYSPRDVHHQRPLDYKQNIASPKNCPVGGTGIKR